MATSLRMLPLPLDFGSKYLGALGEAVVVRVSDSVREHQCEDLYSFQSLIAHSGVR